MAVAVRRGTGKGQERCAIKTSAAAQAMVNMLWQVKHGRLQRLRSMLLHELTQTGMAAVGPTHSAQQPMPHTFHGLGLGLAHHAQILRTQQSTAVNASSQA